MKKILLSSLFVLISATFSQAGTADSSDTVLTFNSPAYEIALSPNVTARYTDGPNTAGAAQQWYVAGTYHKGGTYTYATAADITKIYKMENDDSNQLDQMPTAAASESTWSANSWEL